ncbi:aminotransferase class V-fold PLP-dependent enzyme [Lacisediminihabitans changchengi]|uniref:Aminotransferase class V-fold PLP-dependent enzyme n=1 Tax=Lacisediminihabitans changchengi TaxID=2787634 RepID=A0A934SJQ4_9MICO|nr:aminotransferase class V-fold PLP-dependent enzyme [Lacisediminihabitans changchengi]MBK4346614.1 aminotransferase class V-fold PLP-dependent enzyme [Lacisediminihabitans changchengi]
MSPSPRLGRAVASFASPRGYLAAATMGLPTAETLAAQRADLDLWESAQRNPMDYDGVVSRTRESYARLVGVAAARVAIGSQTSAIASVIAAAVPAGAEVLTVDGEFSSMVFPFLQRRDVRVRSVQVGQLAEAVGDDTWLIAFSHIQSSTGQVADVDAIVAAAKRHGAYTFCDTTQSAGVHPVDASVFDATVCHAYKWLCSPRGVAFLTLSASFQKLLTPTQAGWYSGDEIWQSCYGPAMRLADDARAFDVSPAWPAWVGAEPAIRMFSELDITEIWDRVAGLGNALCDGLGIPRQERAIVTWADPDGVDLAALAAAGIRASGRAGRLRAAFHLWNDDCDVAAVLATLLPLRKLRTAVTTTPEVNDLRVPVS